MKIRVFEAFSGYGSQSMALRNIGVEYEVVAISEINKYAITAYEAIHGKINNLGDISKINIENIPKHDLFTYSFPCQDISIAGKQEGIKQNKTRSGLLYECEKIIEHCKPKYLLLENVKNLVGKKFKPQFDKWLEYLEELGYTNYWQVLNAKDYGVPQNRERVFVVSILGEHKPYSFPKPITLDKRISDFLDKDGVSGSISDIIVDEDIKPSVRVNFLREKDEIAKTKKDIYVCQCKSGWQDNKVGVNVTPTVRAGNSFLAVYNDYRIKKINEVEAFRLMGLSSEDIKKIQLSGISKSQQYKMAGNSIVVQVLEKIFENLFLK